MSTLIVSLSMIDCKSFAKKEKEKRKENYLKMTNCHDFISIRLLFFGRKIRKTIILYEVIRIKKPRQQDIWFEVKHTRLHS
jgi:hypothetical protein